MRAHKQRVTMKYTEVVYYDDDGVEVTRERNHDDWAYDADEKVELTDEEREDYL